MIVCMTIVLYICMVDSALAHNYVFRRSRKVYIHHYTTSYIKEWFPPLEVPEDIVIANDVIRNEGKELQGGTTNVITHA